MNGLEFKHPQLLESVLSAEADPSYISLTGAESVTEATYSPSSGAGTSTLIFRVEPPSTNTVLDSVMLMKMKIRVTATSPNIAGGAKGTVWGRGCLESWPINRMIQNISLKINNNNISNQTYDQVSLVERMLPDYEFISKYGASFPFMRNKLPLASEGASYYAYASGSTSISPFATQQESSSDWELSRYAFPVVEEKYLNAASPPAEVAAGTNHTSGVATAYKIYEVTEPLILPLASIARQHGIANISKLEVSVTFVNDPHNYIVCNPMNLNAAGATGISQIRDPYGTAADLVNIGLSCANTASDDVNTACTLAVTRSDEKLLLRFLTPSVSIPDVISLPVERTVRNTHADAGSVTANSTGKVVTQAIRMNQVPDMLFFCVRAPLEDSTLKNPLRPDYLYPIENINLQVGNVIGILSGASQEQLYQMSKRNGYCGSYYEWCRGGCVLAVKVGQDIKGIPGSNEQFTLSATITWRNTDQGPRSKWSLDTYVNTSAVLRLSATNAVLVDGVSKDVVESKLLEDRVVELPTSALDEMSGSGFKSAFRKIGRFFKNTGKKLYNEAIKPTANDLYYDVIKPGVNRSVGLVRNVGQGGVKLLGNAVDGALDAAEASSRSMSAGRQIGGAMHEFQQQRKYLR